MHRRLSVLSVAFLCSCGSERAIDQPIADATSAEVTTPKAEEDEALPARPFTEQTPTQRTWWVSSRECVGGTFNDEHPRERFVVEKHTLVHKYDTLRARNGYCETSKFFGLHTVMAFDKLSDEFVAGQGKEDMHMRTRGSATLELTPVEKAQTCYASSGEVLSRQATPWKDEELDVHFDVDVRTAKITMRYPSICGGGGVYEATLELRDDNAT